MTNFSELVERHIYQDLKDMLGENVTELYQEFIQDAADILERLSDCIDRGSPEEVREAAHLLKSSSSNLGIRDIARTCNQLEQHARSGSLASARDLFTEIEESYLKLCSCKLELNS